MIHEFIMEETYTTAFKTMLHSSGNVQPIPHGRLICKVEEPEDQYFMVAYPDEDEFRDTLWMVRVTITDREKKTINVLSNYVVFGNIELDGSYTYLGHPLIFGCDE